MARPNTEGVAPQRLPLPSSAFCGEAFSPAPRRDVCSLATRVRPAYAARVGLEDPALLEKRLLYFRPRDEAARAPAKPPPESLDQRGRSHSIALRGAQGLPPAPARAKRRGTMNQPSRAEKFVLPEGVRSSPSRATRRFPTRERSFVQKEDHTLGNTVRMQLHRDPNVVFALYQVPHPSDNRIVVKVRAGSSRRARSFSPRRAHRDASPPERVRSIASGVSL